jgi:cytochrome P450
MRRPTVAVVTDLSLDDRLAALFAGQPDALAQAPAIYRDLREQTPVRRHGETVLFSRYRDARTLMRDNINLGKSSAHDTLTARDAVARMTEDEQAAFTRVRAFELLQLTLTDGATHTRLRQIMHRSMTPRRIAGLQAAIQGYVDEQLDALADQTEPDLMPLAYMLPLMAICDLLEIPQADRLLIRDWSRAIGANKGAIPNVPKLLAADTAVSEFRAYLTAMLDEHRRTARRDNLFAALMDAEGDNLTTDEFTSNFVMLLFAGHETTTNLIGIGIYELLRRPDQWRRLVADPELAGPAVEELLRFVTPVQWTARAAVRDFSYEGLDISEGTLVLQIIAAANRDPEQFPDPERIDIDRDSRAHLGLGVGIHFCIGASLARLEARCALSSLAHRFPALDLASDDLRWRGSAMLRSPEHVMVSLGPTDERQVPTVRLV